MEKKNENITSLKTKSLEKAVLSHLSTTYIYKFFRRQTMVDGILIHSRSNFYPGFLLNQVGMFGASCKK